LAIGWRRRHPCFAVGWCWYLGTLVPVIGLVQIGHQQMADRYTYLPLVGVFMALVWLSADVLPAVLRRKALVPAVAVVRLAVLAVAGWRQTAFWHAGERLFLRTIASTRPNAFAEDALGHVLLVQGRIAEAQARFVRAPEIEPKSVSALGNM